MKTIRRWFWRLTGWDGELCQRCGRKYFETIWQAKDTLWDDVVDHRWRLLCPRCFGELAGDRGILVLWEPYEPRQ